MTGSSTKGAKDNVDEGLYSRQLYVMGHEAQRKMACSDVLLVGMNGLGVEAAKNIVLAGVRSLTIVDETPTQWADLASQFYLTEKDIGKPRASACVNRLAELNPYVKVTCHSDSGGHADGMMTNGDANGASNGESASNGATMHYNSAVLADEAFLQKFGCVVLVDTLLEDQLRVDAFCHEHGIPVIIGDVRGVFASIFCDFGRAFTVSDKDGEAASSCLVSSITKDKEPLVTVNEDQRHNLVTGDVVKFTSMDGMQELEDKEYTIKEASPFSFHITDCDTSDFSTFNSGYVNQVKKPVTLAFRPLKDAIESPEAFIETDFAKIGRPGVLHVAFRALHDFMSSKGRLPKPGNMAEAKEVLQLAKDINGKAEEDKKVDLEAASESDAVVRLALTSQGTICPMCAAVGGIIGQEVLKACSGKFTPIKQWLYFDAVEALSKEPLGEEEVKPVGSRYDGQIMVFGKKMQEALGNQKMFLVGAGAIGCEMLKNWALMGVGCGKKGKVHVTDMDLIERSNLSRQFLFRAKDIGAAKSATATAAAKQMNPAFSTNTFIEKCAPNTESVFNDDFYSSLDFVCTALDNVEARLYIDQRCVFYRKPMLESGTLGTKGNTQVVVPYLTENYGASRDPPEKSIPVCTLKNFPYQIEHTLQWARDWFEGVYKQNADDVNVYLTSPDFNAQLNAQQNTKLETLKRISDSLGAKRPRSYKDCVTWARLTFQTMFHNEPAQLLHNFPADSLTSSGTPFWSGSKRAPTPLEFDEGDSTNVSFVRSVARLRALNYGLEVTAEEDDELLVYVRDVKVPAWAPAEGVKIATTEAEAKEQSEGGVVDVETQCNNVLKSLPMKEELQGFAMTGVEFDKDVDSHMEVITSTSNLRARCYKIPEADMHKSRLIAGKIIPAIATTTALVTGLVCLEMYKMLQHQAEGDDGPAPIEKFKNWFLNLAIPQFACSEPLPPARTTAMVKGEEWKWSAWDSINIDEGDITLRELFDHLEEKYGLEVSMLSYGVSMLYSFFANHKKIKERMPMKMTQLVESVTKNAVPPSQRYLILEICVTDKESEAEVDVPYIRLKLR